MRMAGMTGPSPPPGSLRAPGSLAAQSSSLDTHAHSAHEAAEARGQGPGAGPDRVQAALPRLWDQS